MPAVCAGEQIVDKLKSLADIAVDLDSPRSQRPRHFSPANAGYFMRLD